jgi:RNA polymerase sigma-70 factor (ECF subfamily)
MDGDPASGGDFAEVLRLARGGDEGAWRTLFGIVSGRVVAFLVSRGASDPEEVAGDAFVDMVRSVDRFSGDQSAFVSWVITIAHRRLIDSQRASARRLEVVTDPAEVDDPVPVAEADLSVGLVAAARARQLLDELTPDQADVVALRIYGGLTLPEIADHLDKPLTAVKSLQHRALERLRRSLDAN